MLRKLTKILKPRHAIVNTSAFFHGPYNKLSISSNLINKTPLIKLPQRQYIEWSNRNHFLESWTTNKALKDWIHEQISHFQPARVHLCDGSIQETKEIIQLLIGQGTLIKLNENFLPNSYITRSDKDDVARLESCTYICSESSNEAGPTNNWMDPDTANKKISQLFENTMKGRTMYVIPFCMGPLNSEHSKLGVQITDSPLVVTLMRTMTRMGISVSRLLTANKDFVPCVHSLGRPLDRNDMDVAWPCNSEKLVAHFPEQGRIFSYGSGYGGNALLGKKCLGLRIASCMARREGWLAEHMLIVSVTNPEGAKKYFAAAFPSACGKTNMAMMKSMLPGWKIECIGDDIAWMRFDPKDGKLYAINPESGFFGVAPGTNDKTNPNMMECIKNDTIFMNVALKPDFDVWWEGKTEQKPASVMTWLKKEWKKDDGPCEAAHPNSRFCAPISNCPILDSNWDNPKGVPIDGIILGGRRSDVMPLAFESRDWTHGVFLGSVMGSETTAAAVGRRGLLRIDPFAMRPFCGYNMADYFTHWLKLGEKWGKMGNLPKIFHVNWFKKKENRFLWPGFGENMRVLKWIYERCEKSAGSDNNFVEKAIGKIPRAQDLDLRRLEISKEDLDDLLKVDNDEWKGEIGRFREFYEQFSREKMPEKLWEELNRLEAKVSKKKSEKKTE